MPIREAIEAQMGRPEFECDVVLQGPYENDTKVGMDGDVDVIVRLSSKLMPAVVAVTGERLQGEGSHRFVL